MKKLNNKGYLTVEVVLASVIAFGLAYFLLNLTIKVKDKVYIINEERDVYSILKELHTNRYYLMSILNRNLTKKLINEEKNNDNLL